MIRSISHRITLIIVAVSAFTIIAGAAIFSYLMIKNLKDNYVQQGIMDLDLITEYLVLPLSFNNKERANEILSKVATKPYIQYCALFDADNLLFVDYIIEGTEVQSIEVDVNRTEGYHFDKDILNIYKPVIHEDQYYGWIIIFVNTELSLVIKKHVYITLLIIISILAISLLLTLVIKNSVSNPIVKLVKEMNNLSIQEVYTQEIKSTKGPQEIQQLYTAFNRLTNKIADRETRIELIVNELRQNETKFRTLTENSPDIVVRFTTDLHIDYANLSFTRLLGNKEKEIIGEPLTAVEMTDSEINALLIKYLNNAVNTKKVSHLQININNHPDVFYDFSFVPELSREKAIISVLCIGRDITRIKEAELHLMQAKIKAEESDRLKSAFLANMSHEIRTPMNAIIGFSQLIKEDELNSREREEFINIIQQRGKDLMMIIDDIIDLSKIEAGEFNLNYEAFDLRSLIQEIQLFYQKKLRHEKREEPLDIFCHVDHDLPTHFNSAPSAIKQILFNLLSNAIKFTQKGYIRFGAKKGLQENTIQFYVEDTGIGLSEENIKNIFNRFVQVEEYSTRQYGGTGLGLSICKGLITQMRGEIWVESKQDKGSTFYFMLPTYNTAASSN